MSPPWNADRSLARKNAGAAEPNRAGESLSRASHGGADTVRVPLIRPNPPKLSALTDALAEIEDSGIFSNYGPVNSRFEEQIIATVFNSNGACVTVANATLGLMISIRQAVGWRPRGRYALMPSFTFAAAAHAALWCGLTPLLCDIDPETWLPDAEAETALLKRYGDDIAIIVPNATFGNSLDLARYNSLSASYDVPVVIDSAASFGSQDMQGKAFGIGSRHPLVFSMHATKTFATAEAGLIYSADKQSIASLRAMGNFGFGQPRTATMPGLNTKLSEVSALLGLVKVRDLEAIADHRHRLYELYRRLLPEFTFQRMTGRRTAHQFVSILVPKSLSSRVSEVVAHLGQRGIGSGRYFVPHLAEQPFFQQNCIIDKLPVTDAVSRRIIALPMSDFLTVDEVGHVCQVFREVCRLCAGSNSMLGPDRLTLCPPLEGMRNRGA